jgi:hypothetical protein
MPTISSPPMVGCLPWRNGAFWSVIADCWPLPWRARNNTDQDGRRQPKINAVRKRATRTKRDIAKQVENVAVRKSPLANTTYAKFRRLITRSCLLTEPLGRIGMPQFSYGVNDSKVDLIPDFL